MEKNNSVFVAEGDQDGFFVKQAGKFLSVKNNRVIAA